MSSECMLSSETRIEIMSKYLNFLGGNYLEIGCWEGGSLCLIDYKMKTKYKKVISVNGIDPFLGSFHVVGIEAVDNKKRNDKGEVNFVKLTKQREILYRNIKDRSNINFFEMKAEDFDKCKTDNELLDMNISVCYIDGCHEHEYVTIDWKLCLRAIGDKPGIIVFDDTHASGVRSSIKMMLQHLENNSYMFYKKNDSDIFINWIPDKKTIAELKPIQLEKFINKVGQKFYEKILTEFELKNPGEEEQ